MYCHVGVYEGDLDNLAEIARGFRPYWNVEGYGMTASDDPAVLETFQPLLKDTIQGEWQHAFLSVLPRDKTVPFHRDSFATDRERHHLVLSTNERCWNFHDEGWQHLVLGRIYTMNPRQEHASLNWGDSARIHLVVDVRKNDV